MLSTLCSLMLLAPVPFQQTITTSLDADLRQFAPSWGSALAAQIARVLRWKGDLNRDIHKGDKLEVLFEMMPEPEVLALHYHGLSLKLEAYRFVDSDGLARLYDASGQLIEPKLKSAPTRYGQITEIVQSGRGKRKHAGLDFKAPEGMPVTLPFAGTVSRINWSTRTNGQCVEIATPDAKLLRFLHLSAIEPSVKEGASLLAGATVGKVGNTGHSNAPHLHYEVRALDNEILDPLKIHGTEVGFVATQDAFFRERDRLKMLLNQNTGVTN